MTHQTALSLGVNLRVLAADKSDPAVAAGGAPHIAGMLAAASTLPVIGVLPRCAGCDGLESLLSIAQMPAAIPVDTMAIGGAANAAPLAIPRNNEGAR